VGGTEGGTDGEREEGREGERERGKDYQQEQIINVILDVAQGLKEAMS